jgi:preprotein translocase subunit SecD
MYQFAKWKYWLVILVMLFGIVFALPNVFGEAPALQLSRNDRKPMSEEDSTRVLGVLKGESITFDTSYLEKDRMVLRFAKNDNDQRTKARAAILKGTGGDYLIALANASRMPDWIRHIGLKPMSLGLDLRGGVHFVYEVDINAAITQSLESLASDARTLLREKRIPYDNVTLENNVLRVTLRSASDLKAASDALKTSDGGYDVKTQNEGVGAYIELRLTPAEIKRRQDLAVQQNITTLRNRIDELGVSEPLVSKQALNRIEVQLPGVDDPNEAIRVLGATATLEFRLVDMNGNAYDAERTKRVPIGSKLYKMRQDGTPILLKREIVVSGDQLTDAMPGFTEGLPSVNVKLDARGGARMLKTTRENVGKRMAVVYIEQKRLAEGEVCKGTRSGNDCVEEEVISAPTIQGVFGQSFQITGLMATEASELSLLLRAGSLAAPQAIVEQRSVGPSLGQDNIDRGIRAMLIGLVLTFAFMAVYYRAFGWIANLVLVSNLILTVGLLSMLQASLSLPGIAAVVFHMGIAVDANILIYERIREELRMGNSPLSSINIGFEKAFATIADSNVTTLIAGVVLFAFGTGTIRSFAIVMTLGILTSLFTSVIGSRALVHAIWGNRRKLDHLSI